MSISLSYDKLVQITADLEARNRMLSRFAVSFQAASQSMAFINLDGQFVEVNEAFCNGLGYSREELLQMQAIELKPETLRSAFKQGFALLKEQSCISLETVYLHKNGTPIPCEVSATVIRQERKSLIHVVAHDITKRKQNEDTLRRFEKIFSLSQDLIAYVDNNYIYRMVNDQFCYETGKSSDQIVGCSCAEVLGKDMFTQVVKPVIDRCLTGEIVRNLAWVVDYPIIGKRYRDTTCYPDQATDGSIKGVYAIIHWGTVLPK